MRFRLIFTTYFVCDDWRGICSLSDKILLMPLGIKTAVGVNAIQMYGTLNAIRYYFNNYVHASCKELIFDTMYAFAQQIKVKVCYEAPHKNHRFSEQQMILSYD